MEPRIEHTHGSSGTPAMSRTANGGRSDGVRGGRNRLAAEGCRGREGPGEKVVGGKTVSAIWSVESNGSIHLSRWTGAPITEEKGDNWVLKKCYNQSKSCRFGGGGGQYT